MRKQIATSGFIAPEYKIYKLEQRVEVLEEKVLKRVKGQRATEPQRFLLFY
jgi:hypothetical protein